MDPLVSILIPAYNGEAFLADTLRSALGQTWPRKEIIVVDDGSRDGTLAVARQFESATVKVVTQPNQGSAATRNRCYALSQGDFIQWLDADDLLHPDKVRLQVEAAREGGTERTLYSAGWSYFINRPATARFVPGPLWESLDPVEWLVRKMNHNAHMQTGTWLVSRALSEATGAWDATLATDDDGEYFARMFLHCDGVRFVPGSRVYYRVHPNARVSYIGRNQRKMESQLESMERHIRYLRSLEDSPRTRAACVNYLRNWQLTFYPERPDLVERARKLAESLGGTLPPPVLPAKYAVIQKLFGWSAAKLTQVYYNQVKSSLVCGWDRLVWRLQGAPRVPEVWSA